MQRTLTLLTLALTGVLPGCLATAPPQVVAARAGVVRADSAGQGATVARLLDSLAPRVRALLPDTRDEPLEVWVQRELSLYTHWSVDQEVPAFTVEDGRRIHIAEAGYRQLSAALGHELVHALLGPGWQTLPAVAEEGLADWVQEVLHPDLASSMRADHLAKASAAFGGMRFGLWCPRSIQGGRRLASFSFPGPLAGQEPIDDPRQALDEGAPPSPGGSLWRPYAVSVSDPRLYGIGYLTVARLVERVGLDGLHALCQRARAGGLEQVPGAWLLSAADLDRDPEHWQRVIVGRVGRYELRALGQSLAPFLAELIRTSPLAGPGRAGAEAFLASYRPRLGLEHGLVRLPLAWVPALRRAIRSTTGSVSSPAAVPARPSSPNGPRCSACPPPTAAAGR